MIVEHGRDNFFYSASEYMKEHLFYCVLSDSSIACNQLNIADSVLNENHM